MLKWLEEWARKHAELVVVGLASENDMNALREPWLSGEPMRALLEENIEADRICKDTYGYQIPWLIHAASQQLRWMGKDSLAKVLASVALLVELGVPNEVAAWVFLAGVRSRAASTELANYGAHLGGSSREIRRRLQDSDVVEELKKHVSEATQTWLDLHWSASIFPPAEIPRLPAFRLDALAESDRIFARRSGDETYLCSVDGVERFAVEVSDKWPFDRVANDYRFCFDQVDGRFELRTRDPRLEADLMA